MVNDQPPGRCAGANERPTQVDNRASPVDPHRESGHSEAPYLDLLSVYTIPCLRTVPVDGCWSFETGTHVADFSCSYGGLVCIIAPTPSTV